MARNSPTSVELIDQFICVVDGYMGVTSELLRELVRRGVTLSEAAHAENVSDAVHRLAHCRRKVVREIEDIGPRLAAVLESCVLAERGATFQDICKLASDIVVSVPRDPYRPGDGLRWTGWEAVDGVKLDASRGYFESDDDGFGMRVLDADGREHYIQVKLTAEAARRIRETPRPPKGEGSKAKPRQWLADALLAIKDHRDWNDAKVAEEVGVHPSTLSRSEVYQAAAAKIRQEQKPPSGWKDPKTGEMDATDRD